MLRVYLIQILLALFALIPLTRNELISICIGLSESQSFFRFRMVGLPLLRRGVPLIRDGYTVLNAAEAC